MSVVSTDLHGPEGIDPTKVDPESLLKKASEPPPAWLEFLRPWLYPSSFLSVTISCGLGIYSTWADTARVSFIITNYVMFLVIFCFLRWAQEISSLKDTTEEEEDMKVVFRSLSVAASGWFSMQIASMVPWELAAVIWTLWLPIVLAEAYVNHKYSNVPRESLLLVHFFQNLRGRHRIDDSGACLQLLRISHVQGLGRRRQLPEDSNQTMRPENL